MGIRLCYLRASVFHDFVLCAGYPLHALILAKIPDLLSLRGYAQGSIAEPSSENVLWFNEFVFKNS